MGKSGDARDDLPWGKWRRRFWCEKIRKSSWYWIYVRTSSQRGSDLRFTFHLKNTSNFTIFTMVSAARLFLFKEISDISKTLDTCRLNNLEANNERFSRIESLCLVRFWPFLWVGAPETTVAKEPVQVVSSFSVNTKKLSGPRIPVGSKRIGERNELRGPDNFDVFGAPIHSQSHRTNFGSQQQRPDAEFKNATKGQPIDPTKHTLSFYRHQRRNEGSVLECCFPSIRLIFVPKFPELEIQSKIPTVFASQKYRQRQRSYPDHVYQYVSKT